MKIDGRSYRTIWVGDDGWSVESSTRPGCRTRFETRSLATLDEAAEAIATMVVRGAPLIGVDGGLRALPRARATTRATPASSAPRRGSPRTRPTAVNLRWALDRMAAIVLAPPAGASAPPRPTPRRPRIGRRGRRDAAARSASTAPR